MALQKPLVCARCKSATARQGREWTAVRASTSTAAALTWSAVQERVLLRLAQTYYAADGGAWWR